MRWLIKFLSCLIPIKKWRKTVRNKLDYLLITRPYLNKLKKQYTDCIFLLSPHAGIGELTQSLCLMKGLKERINKSIVVLTKRKTEYDICRFYDKTVTCHYDPDLNIRSVSLMEYDFKSGNIYSLYQLPKPEAIKRSCDIDYLKDYFLLDQNTEVERIKPVRPDIVKDDLLMLERNLKSRKSILIFPEANTYDSSVISKKTWIMVANRLKDKGFICVFNSKEVFDGFQSIFLPIRETVYLSSLVSNIITFRSGLSELLALSTTCLMLVVYPNGTSHLFRKECNVSIDDFLAKRLKSSMKQSDLRNDPDNPIIKTFNHVALDRNFNRKNCKNFRYDFNNDNFINFLCSEINKDI